MSNGEYIPTDTLIKRSRIEVDGNVEYCPGILRKIDEFKLIEREIKEQIEGKG